MRRLMRGWGVGVALLAAVASRAQQPPSNAELLKIVEKQNQQIEELRNRIKEIENRQQSQAPAAGSQADVAQLKKNLLETNEALAQTNRKLEQTDQKFTLGKGIENLKFTGDLRLRYETRDQDFERVKRPDEDRSRYRTRLRLGFIWTNPSESWEIGAGLASGGNDGRSTNDTWSENVIFETKDIRLDYAYAKHTWKIDDTPLSLTLGQQRSPFITTVMNWDDDLDPIGATIQYGDPKGKEYAGPFVTLGAYDVLWGVNTDGAKNEESDVMMYAAQCGYSLRTDPADALFALGYRRITNCFQDVQAANKNVYPNSPGLYGMNNSAVGDDYGFDVVDVYAEAKSTVVGVELKPYAHVAYNLSADGVRSQQNIFDRKKGAAWNAKTNPEDPSDNNLAWMTGVDVTKGKWKLGYAYAYIEADAVFGPMKDSDLGETAGLMDTDIEGHLLKLSYNFTKNLSLGVTGMLLERIEGGSSQTGLGEADKTALGQMDLVYKF